VSLRPRLIERARRLAIHVLPAGPYALVAFLYLATSPWHAGLNNPNEMVRVYMSAAWIDHHDFTIDKIVHRWGGVDDKAIRDGKLYSSKAPLQSLIGVPIYALSKPLLKGLGLEADRRHVTTVLRIFGSAIFGIGFCWMLLAWAKKRATELGASPTAGTAVGLSLALGTMLYPYSLTFTGHLLAALGAGGTLLGAIALSRCEERSWRFRGIAALTGLAAATTPIAEYPAALAALPIAIAALFVPKAWIARLEVAILMLVGGAPMLALGGWSHQQMWGSPLKTGYAFLENASYADVVKPGFFGIDGPKLEAFAGALFSPGTGLFFFSPVLLVGLFAMLLAIRRPKIEGAPEPLPRVLVWASIAAVLLEIAFITSYKGWRGGWTLGPRYIIPVAPLLGIWVIEALRHPSVRPFIAGLGAASVLGTGFAAGLYPHLSDVYNNPLWTFVWPSYRRGEMTYGIGQALGLDGRGANLVHVLPLIFAMIYIALGGARADTPRILRLIGIPAIQRGIFVAVLLASYLAIVALVPERDAIAAQHENARLWGFWEPKQKHPKPLDDRPENLLFRARENVQAIVVENVAPSGQSRKCHARFGGPCVYGDQPWHHLAPETLEMNGRTEQILFFHPIAGNVLRATIPVRAGTKTAIFRYGLADASIAAPNPHPVEIKLAQNGAIKAEAKAGKDRGLQHLELTITSTAPLVLDLRVEVDGARVFGFDLEEYR
jgi:hypothetical protein